MQVTVTDPSGLNWVRLYYEPPGLPPLTYGTMQIVGKSTFLFTLTPGDWIDGEIGLWVRAQDSLGNTSAYVPFGNPYSTADPSLLWDPFCIT
jgi:hypothetical protein